MLVSELLTHLLKLGFTLRPEGDKLHVAPRSALTPELRTAIAEHKRELMALLQAGEGHKRGVQPVRTVPKPEVIADEVERLMALGQRLKRGEIAAIRCGITGKRCTSCQGVPCWGSQPWEEDIE
jgi:hypothetical protein